MLDKKKKEYYLEHYVSDNSTYRKQLYKFCPTFLNRTPPQVEDNLSTKAPLPPSETATARPTETATRTPAPTETPTPTITPTYAVFRGVVIPDRLSCRFGPGVTASRDGDEVTVKWNELPMRAGDDSEQTPYVVEAWLCVDGEIVFTPTGSYANQAVLVDEKGCEEASHERVLAAEKHGYTQGAEISWPPHAE